MISSYGITAKSITKATSVKTTKQTISKAIRGSRLILDSPFEVVLDQCCQARYAPPSRSGGDKNSGKDQHNILEKKPRLPINPICTQTYYERRRID